MEVIDTRTGLPQVAHDVISCPFCGDACHPASETSSSFASGSAYVAIHYHCLNGCCWELRIHSEDSDLQVGCVLFGVDQELREQRRSETIMSCLSA
jgi:hypothetical protein